MALTAPKGPMLKLTPSLVPILLFLAACPCGTINGAGLDDLSIVCPDDSASASGDESTSADSSDGSSTGSDAPCGANPGTPFGPCDHGGCGADLKCTKTASGNMCQPHCGDCNVGKWDECLDAISEAGHDGYVCLSDQGNPCRPGCVDDAGCDLGTVCDERSGSCVWPVPLCDAQPGHAFGSCDGGLCGSNLSCHTSAQGSICRPKCSQCLQTFGACIDDIAISNISTCDGDGKCIVGCFTDLDCEGGTVCDNTGTCVWPKNP